MASRPDPGAGYEPAPFIPHPWLKDPHLQTIVAELMPRVFGSEHAAWHAAEQEVLLDLEDGDSLLGYLHLHPDDPERQRPLVLHLHGMEGSANAGCHKGMSSKAFAAGFHSLRFNYRNCSDTEAYSRQIYHARQTHDVLRVLEIMQERWGIQRFYATGTSLGANILLRLLIDGAPQALQGGVAISPPIQLSACSEALSRGFCRVYDQFFLASMKRKLRRKLKLSPDGESLRPLVEQLGKVRSLRAFDTLVTAPLGGFESVDAYYAAASTVGELDRIRVPTLIIHAQDDPFLPFQMYQAQHEAIASNPYLVTAFPRHGGHVGFLGPTRPRAPWMDSRWSENEAIAFLVAQERVKKS